jgi:murein DD-endopeptidase MepM/ murein hydrolase activator NlpD
VLTTFIFVLASVVARMPSAAVVPGGVVRWPGPSLLECRMGNDSWPPYAEACWYPIDLERRGNLELVRRSTGGIASRLVHVAKYPYPTEELTVDPKFVSPPPESLERIEREQAAVLRVLSLDTTRRYSLPLGPPLASLPVSSRFGARRVFNGEARNPHSGADFSAREGTPVLAPADGRVALADDHYFAGKAVYIDHGDRLISMSFHLSEILVRAGDEVRRGQEIGRVGATGRVTGPHLHFALRWRGARIDPTVLLAGKAAQID